ncbi:MAG: class I SAM-dependent methyltransferase [Cyanobacteria bacterium J06631_2]
MSNISIPQNCVVCHSPFVSYVRDVPAPRIKRNIPLYYCMECGSFNNPSGFKEDEEQLQKDLNWNISVIDRNVAASERLFKELTKRYPQAKSVLEIGCGIGTTLSVAKKYFSQVTGYDVNYRAIEYGRKKFDLDLKSEMWSAATTEDYDIVLCISVLEHLEQPRKLFSELAKSVKESGGALFVSVPFFESYKWKYILNPDPTVAGTPFFCNDVHINHFSKKGLIKLGEQHGATSVETIVQGWQGCIFEFDRSQQVWITKGEVQQLAENKFEFKDHDDRNSIYSLHSQTIKQGEAIEAELVVTVWEDSTVVLTLSRHSTKKNEGSSQRHSLTSGTHTVKVDHRFKDDHTGCKIQLRFHHDKPPRIDAKPLKIAVESVTFNKI